jgi:hypothetical protein
VSVSDVESRVSHFLERGGNADLRYGYDVGDHHETYQLEREDIALLLEDHRMLAAIRDRVEEWGAVPWRIKDEDDHVAAIERVLEIVLGRGDAL